MTFGSVDGRPRKRAPRSLRGIACTAAGPDGHEEPRGDKNGSYLVPTVVPAEAGSVRHHRLPVWPVVLLLKIGMPIPMLLVALGVGGAVFGGGELKRLGQPLVPSLGRFRGSAGLTLAEVGEPAAHTANPAARLANRGSAGVGAVKAERDVVRH